MGIYLSISVSLSLSIYIYIYTCMYMCIHVHILFVLSERLPIAYITNPWAPVEETTGPHRVTMEKTKNLGRRAKSQLRT